MWIWSCQQYNHTHLLHFDLTINQREKQGLYCGKILKHIELSKKGVKGCRCTYWMQGNTQSLFLPIVLANIMFTQKNNSFSRINREPATLGSRLVCQGCVRWSWGGLSRNEFWVAKLNQVIWGNRASFGYSGVPFSSGLDLWLFFWT